MSAKYRAIADALKKDAQEMLEDKRARLEQSRLSAE